MPMPNKPRKGPKMPGPPKMMDGGKSLKGNATNVIRKLGHNPRPAGRTAKALIK